MRPPQRALRDALAGTDTAQPSGFGGQQLGLPECPVARMQAHFVAALVDASHQPADRRLFGLVRRIHRRHGAAADEIERARQCMAFGQVHQPVEGVGRVGAAQPAPAGEHDPRCLQRAQRLVATQQVEADLAQQAVARAVGVAAGEVDVVRRAHLERRAVQRQAGPGARRELSQDIHPLIDDGPVEVGVPHCVRGTGREPAVGVTRGVADLFAPGQRPPEQSGQVVVQDPAVARRFGQRPGQFCASRRGNRTAQCAGPALCRRIPESTGPGLRPSPSKSSIGRSNMIAPGASAMRRTTPASPWVESVSPVWIRSRSTSCSQAMAWLERMRRGGEVMTGACPREIQSQP